VSGGRDPVLHLDSPRTARASSLQFLPSDHANFVYQEHLGSLGAQMGAVIKLDLTSDVTHLIVGNINSAKYRYVAKSREDVKVLSPQWLYAVNAVWMQGGGVDVAALENQYRSPTFHGLSICLTGFDDRTKAYTTARARILT
jgi:hypothetical protein